MWKCLQNNMHPKNAQNEENDKTKKSNDVKMPKKAGIWK